MSTFRQIENDYVQKCSKTLLTPLQPCTIIFAIFKSVPTMFDWLHLPKFCITVCVHGFRSSGYAWDHVKMRASLL